MKLKKITIASLALLAFALPAKAQYYEIANQLTNLISPALSGSMKYKGYVETQVIAGFGDNKANFYGISTSQGFQYSSWFFMGAGLGIDVATGKDAPLKDDAWNYPTSKTKVMVPVFSDFRFNIPVSQYASLVADVKVGAAWLLGNRYLSLEKGVLNTATQFYVSPTVSVRIPINDKNPRQAVNVGVSYQLLTANSNSYYGYNNPTLNGLGLTIGYEW